MRRSNDGRRRARQPLHGPRLTMRVAALGFHHETNTFQSVETDYGAFVNFEFLRGAQIAERHAGANSTLTGYFKGAARFEFELVPLLFTFTGPTGTITK